MCVPNTTYIRVQNVAINYYCSLVIFFDTCSVFSVAQQNFLSLSSCFVEIEFSVTIDHHMICPLKERQYCRVEYVKAIECEHKMTIIVPGASI